jgi:hypothetical protein
MTWPAALLWVFILAAAVSRPSVSLYLLFASEIFSGLSLLPPSIIGNVAASTVCGAVFIAKYALADKQYNFILAQLLDVRRFGLLALFSVYMLATAILYPRLFQGQVELFSLNSPTSPSSLAPTSANITQPIYLLISIAVAVIFGTAGQTLQFRRTFLHAALAGAILLVISGFVDMIAGDLGHEDALAAFHNATYSLLESAEIAGQKRVVGFMPEASSFGSACTGSLALLLFNREFYDGAVRTYVVPALCAVLAYMIYASTSSGAYVGLAILAALAVARYMGALALTGPLSAAQIRQLFWITVILAGIALICIFPANAFVAHLGDLLDKVVFEKTGSSSYIERSSWTQAGVAAFYTTHGIGVGVGSIRTSNWFVNFVASTGVIGAVLFGGFVGLALWPARRYADAATSRFALAMKLTILPGFIVSELSATTPDPGWTAMAYLGLIYALKQTRRAAAGNQPG